MTMQEIQTRQAEIETRLQTIGQIAERATKEKVEDNLDALHTEVENLLQERKQLEAEELKIRSSVNDFQEVVKNDENNKKEERNMNNKYSTMEYRKAFMDYIRTGEMADILKRSDAFTQTSDVGSVIVPTTITSQLFKKSTNSGALYDLVTKTSYPAGMSVKTMATEFEISWVAERATSEHKKAETSYVSFSGFKGLIKFAQSFEVSVETLPEFEQAVVERMLDGARKSFDKAIVLGSGNGQPKGFLLDGVYTGANAKAVKLTADDVAKYSAWISVFAKVPVEKKNTGVWVMNDSDWTQYILGMVDDVHRPIAVERAGVDGMPRKYFLGRPVITLENQGLPTFDALTGNATASKDTAFAAFVDLSDYWLNLNKEMAFKDYIDEDTDDRIKKLIVLADGKMVDKTSIVPVCKGVKGA